MGRMNEADCAFGMSVAYLWEPDRDLLAAWHNRTRRSQSRFTYDAATRRTTSLPGAAEALAQRFAYDEHHNVLRRDRRLSATEFPAPSTKPASRPRKRKDEKSDMAVIMAREQGATARSSKRLS